MSYYVEIELHVYEHGPQTTGCGPYRSHAKAEAVAAKIETRLRRGAAKAALDAAYGEDGYSLTVLALRLRTSMEAIAEVMGR